MEPSRGLPDGYFPAEWARIWFGIPIPHLRVELSNNESFTPLVGRGYELGTCKARPTYRNTGSCGVVTVAVRNGGNFGKGEEDVEVGMDRCSLVYDSSQLVIESARAGLGVAAVPPFTVARELAEGSLVRGAAELAAGPRTRNLRRNASPHNVARPCRRGA